jgi:hypothetical protein
MNRTLMLIGGIATAGLLYYLYKKNKETSSNSNDANTNSTSTSGSNYVSPSRNGLNEAQGVSGAFGNAINNLFSTTKSSENLDNPQIDTTTKGWKKLSESLTKWKYFLRDYRKDGLNLKDSDSGNTLSKEATETAYVFATKEIASIEKGITNDKSLSETQKVLLLDKIKAYYNDFLPLLFDKSKYSMDANWYKNAVSKMTLVDYYK